MKARRSISIFAGAILLGLAALVAGCGGETDKTKQANSLQLEPLASNFAGPAPLHVQFDVKRKRSDGDVKYRWDFGGGDTSTEKNPRRIFKKAEYHVVKLFAEDEGGHKDVTSLILRAYDPKVWANRDELSSSPKRVKNTIKRSQIEYYTKYPEALPYDPNSARYETYPYLRPLLLKYERENPKVAAEHRKKRAAVRRYREQQRARGRDLIEQAKKEKKKKKQEAAGSQ